MTFMELGCLLYLYKHCSNDWEISKLFNKNGMSLIAVSCVIFLLTLFYFFLRDITSEYINLLNLWYSIKYDQVCRSVLG